MEAIPNLKDKIEALKNFLEANEEEMSSDSWTYGCEPILVEFFNSLEDSDWKEFRSRIWNWPEKFLVNIAHSFIFLKDENIDCNYIYCRTFLESKEEYNPEDLVQKMYPISGHSINFYQKSLKKFLYRTLFH